MGPTIRRVNAKRAAMSVEEKEKLIVAGATGDANPYFYHEVLVSGESAQP